MKIALASDVHLEFGSYNIENKEGADVLILSGDIMTDPMIGGDEATEFFKACSKQFPIVLYVAGNHEFYHGDLFETRNKIVDFVKQFDNVLFLDNQYTVINGVLFYGGTMWTDFDKENPVIMSGVRFFMNDYRTIANGIVPFTPEDAVKEHKKFLDGLDKALKMSNIDKFVVVGHHAPTKLSTHPRHKDSETNAAYSSDISEFILEHPEIVLWTHGHTHNPFDYTMGQTRVVANPRGYIGHEDIAYAFQLKYIDI